MKVFHGNYGDGNQEGAMGRAFARMGYTPVKYKGNALVKRDGDTVSIVWPSWCDECYDQHDHTDLIVLIIMTSIICNIDVIVLTTTTNVMYV